MPLFFSLTYIIDNTKTTEKILKVCLRYIIVQSVLKNTDMLNFILRKVQNILPKIEL